LKENADVAIEVFIFK